MIVLDTDHMSVLERREQPAVEYLLTRLADGAASRRDDNGD